MLEISLVVLLDNDDEVTELTLELDRLLAVTEEAVLTEELLDVLLALLLDGELLLDDDGEELLDEGDELLAL